MCSVKLDVFNHDRDSENLRYIYPVVSRRAGGVSIGVNLNPNNACNFRCVYCQVPGLTLGKAPELDLAQLESELRWMLTQVLDGDFMQRRVPEEARRLNDVAFSGNGEPTSSPQFFEAIQVVERVLADRGLAGELPIVVITNGSLTDRPEVERGIRALRPLAGRIWFKLDSATQEGAAAINDSKASVTARLERLDRVSRWCPTWVQTCVFARDGQPPSDAERLEYVTALSRLLDAGAPLQGILLYGLARPSMQPEAPELSRLGSSWLEGFAEQIRVLGLPVSVTP